MEISQKALKYQSEYNHDRPLSSFDESLILIKSYGFNPIGVSQIYFEDTFIFETQEEAESAFQKLEKELGLIQGWFYSKENFEKDKIKYENELNCKVLTYYL